MFDDQWSHQQPGRAHLLPTTKHMIGTGSQADYDSNEFPSLAHCSLLPILDCDTALALSHWVSAPAEPWLGLSPAHHCVLGSSPGMPNFDSIIWITVFSCLMFCCSISSPALQSAPAPNDQEHEQHGFPTINNSNKFLLPNACSCPFLTMI